MRSVPFVAALLLASPVLAQEEASDRARETSDRQKVQISSGLDFERGDYGTQTEIEKRRVPLALGVTSGRVRASAQLSWVRLTAPANVVAPSGPLGLPIFVDPTKPSTVETREGLGDLYVSAAYDLPVEGFYASIGTGAKLPTASAAKGLGTGKVDYSVSADLAKPLGPVTPFAGVSYTIAGDPGGYDLRNSFSGQAGASLRLGKSASAQVGYAVAQSQFEGGEDDQRVVGAVNTGVGSNLSLGIYGSGGLSDGAPDVGGGLTLGIKLGR